MPTSTSQSSPLTVQKLWKRLGWLRFFLPVLLLLLVRGITGSNLLDGTKQSQQETITQAVARKTIPITVTANGTVDAERSINLSPKASGVIKTLLVKESDRVRQGQVIAVMDDANLRGDLTQYRGQLAQQESNLNKLLNGNRPEDIALPEHHKDPQDRLIIATAIYFNACLISFDKKFPAYQELDGILISGNL
jgi:HlyD family secretion protein